MFSIDLLKGKGLPQRTSLKRLVLKVLPFIVPMAAVSVFAVDYQRDSSELSTLRTQIEANQQQIVQHKDDVASYEEITRQINRTTSGLSDISKALNYRIQVSGMMLEMVNLLPDDIFVYEIRLDRNTVQERYTDEASNEQKQRLYVRRKLKLTLCGFAAPGSDEAVQAYVNKLKDSAALADIFTEVKPSARQQGEVDGRSAVYYEIECTLKQQG